MALELPPEVRAALAGWTEGLVRGREALRAVPEPSLHVTLAFLGATSPEAVERVWAAVPEASAAPALDTGDLIALPRRRPRVLALVLADPTGAATAFQRSLAGALGLDDGRPWLPHVTLARVRKGHRVAPPLSEAPALARFAAPGVALLRSHPGSRYEIVRRRSLG